MSNDLQNKQITARAPGKIILSGEHAVVYGKPALAMAVNRFVDVTVSDTEDNGFHFELESDCTHHTSSLKELQHLRIEIDKRYEDFIAGKCSIKDVIQVPLELIQYAFIYLAQNLSLPLDKGLKIKIQIDLPIGCGMGASAAVILGLMHALVNYFGITLGAQKQIHFGREIENLQHGKSSGLDLFLSLHGGCYLFENGNAHKHSLPDIPLMLVNTGKPQASTGECVEEVAKHFQNSNIADDFAKITTAMEQAFEQNNIEAVKQCVHENNELLNLIGVVPAKVAKFIEAVKERGCAAKICGSGAIVGDSAGIVLVVGGENVLDIVKEYGYEVLTVQGEESGLRII